ncbi:MAG: hypothetical protein AABX83_00070 [Nanoarchaeota archaeon]
MYRVIYAFGRQGIEITNSSITNFYDKREIEIPSSIKIPDNLEAIEIPEFERTQHYRASQYWYFTVTFPERERFRTGRTLTEEDINREIAKSLEKEFRFLYCQFYVKNK